MINIKLYVMNEIPGLEFKINVIQIIIKYTQIKNKYLLIMSIGHYL
jgi:hypothetical protein